MRIVIKLTLIMVEFNLTHLIELRIKILKFENKMQIRMIKFKNNN